ncbi:NAD(P)/FAD-dependent oxidoreductase [Egibacter rhizosphaerae]|uniref:Pyridine nucleotide-disulfide oxidoreductase domain-containing protein 2 n=1 Tax=Egibacter rhizosphaerae TaxID=1670831 RepID=A0A411YGG9_9ACTN|nr:NAD(P)/FAD-dependent oxidoreductase [Egibacter rhizosphaerae]QBI20385.1 NAD(P)/FAD-dependent oxidoreductase [Egibacter rhizosphaerae]
MAARDVIVVGSGINSLVCAARLARGGHRVTVLERNEELGGCIRTEELFPGFRHDVLSGWYPLFVTSPAYAELGPELEARGLELLNTDTPTAVLTEDGQWTVLSTDRRANVQRLGAVADGEGQRYADELDRFLEEDSGLVFGFLGSEPMSWRASRLVASEVRKQGTRETASFLGRSLETSRAWLERAFASDLTRALLAPWVLHAGLGPDDAYSGVMARVITASLELAGLPVVRGGSANTVAAFRQLIEDHGGELRTGAEVERIVVRQGRASGVRLIDGEQLDADAVFCNVTPTQLYGRLLESEHVPHHVARDASAYRYGRADMQIHFALSGPPNWPDPALADVPMVHLTSGMDGVSRAVNEAQRGLLPAEATVVVGQPTAVDPSRAPEGKWILWIQLQELPSVVTGDAAGELSAPADGAWTEELREAYADRIQQRLARHLPGLDDQVEGRRVYSPADLEALNPNLVGGDPYSGACTLDQFFLWRPMGRTKNHETPVKGLHHIGASTHPGPGLGGVSGYLAAGQLL